VTQCREYELEYWHSAGSISYTHLQLYIGGTVPREYELDTYTTLYTVMTFLFSKFYQLPLSAN